MEQPLEFLKSKISDFPGYADDISRWRSDELVRSYAGEAVADLQNRLQPLDAALDERVGDMLVRVGFANPAAYRTYEAGMRARFDSDAMSAADAGAVEAADRAASIDAVQLPAYLDEVSAALDRRDAVLIVLDERTAANAG
ncbi:MAG: hypothetical protein WB615_15010 [Candidatus Tumulicola sp.]